MGFLQIVGAGIWLVAAAVTGVWIYGLRKLAVQGITRGTVNTAMLFFVSVLMVPTIGLSPFHLLWIFPMAWILGTFHLAFPFSLLSIFGRVFFMLCSIGVRAKEPQ
jgi:hypothetical protein